MIAIRVARSCARCAPSRDRVFTSAASACFRAFSTAGQRSSASASSSSVCNTPGARTIKSRVTGPASLRCLARRFQFARISFRQRKIKVHPGGGFARSGVQRHAHGEPPARDVAVDEVAHGRFQHLHLARQIDGDFALLAVHRAEFHGDLETVPRTIPRP